MARDSMVRPVVVGACPDCEEWLDELGWHVYGDGSGRRNWCNVTERKV